MQDRANGVRGIAMEPITAHYYLSSTLIGVYRTKGAKGNHDMKQPRIDLPRKAIAEFCRRNHIKRLSLFGSVLRGEHGSESDIDFLVEFEQDHIPGYLGLAGMELELSDLLGGRKVDLRTPSELSRYFRDEVLAEAEVQYGE